MTRPQPVVIEGTWAIVEPLNPAKHTGDLWEAGVSDTELWRYMADGPFAGRAAFMANLEAKAVSTDPLFYAILDRASGRAQGHAALMRIEPVHRVIEVGNIVYTAPLQRTRAATEAMYLLARYVFDELGYRRYEWKCDALNEPSRRAALRLGFGFEGIFRQHMIIKGRNRDTAWYSMLDSEWPERKRAFERWLDPGNFDAEGRQRTPLKHN